MDSAEDALTWLRIGEADERVLAVLAILEDELGAAHSQAARAQRALDEERRRAAVLADVVREAVKPGTAVGQGPALLFAMALDEYEHPGTVAAMIDRFNDLRSEEP